jgi:hypothetical protein
MRKNLVKLALMTVLCLFISTINNDIAAQQAQQRLTGKVVDQQGEVTCNLTVHCQIGNLLPVNGEFSVSDTLLP